MRTIAMAAAIVAAAVPGAASAETYRYTLTGAYAATWELPSMPLPDSWVDGQGFAMERVAGDFPRTTSGDAYLDFFSADNGGGLSISDADGPALLRSLRGAQLYTGAEQAPVMRRGVFALTDGGNRRYALTVANLSGGVPEPATWALMILGMGAVAGAMRRRDGGRRRAAGLA